MASTALCANDDAATLASSAPSLAEVCGSLPAPALVGRERELDALDAFLANAANRGGALLLRGEPGAGKSVLLADGADRAENLGMQVWAASGVRSEASVPLAGLHQILRPLLEAAQGQPQPHHEALLATIETVNPATRDTFTIAVATLELLASVASKRPLLIVVDDGHWLDPVTATVLGLVARRLAPEPVALLIALRDGHETALAGFSVPELCIDALDEASAIALLERRAPGLDAGLRARLLAEAAGNPLALVELAAAPRTDRAVFGRPDRLPTTARLDRVFGEQFLHLPAATRTILLVASVDQRATLDEILAAAAVIGDDPFPSVDDVAPAVDGGLVGHDGTRLDFRHPLLPAVIYQREPATRRRRAHAALAAVLVDDRHRSAWHRAASITGPDEGVADELEAAWVTATPCRGPSVRVAALERAAELTADSSVRQQRLLGAAELALDLGEIDRTDRLLSEINSEGCTPLDLARTRLLRDLVEARPVTDSLAVASLVEAAEEASAVEGNDVAVRLLRAAALRSWWSDAGSDIRDRIVAAAQGLSAPEGDPRVLSIVAMADPAGAGDTIHAVSHAAPTSCDPETAFALGTALHMVGAFDRSAILLAEAIGGLRRQGIMWLLPEALALQAWNAVGTGNWSGATAAAEQAVKLASQLGRPLWEAAAKTALAATCAIHGDEQVAESLLAEAEAIAVPRAASAVLADTQFARALVALSAGRHEEAFEHLQRTFDPHDPAHHHIRAAWRIGEFAEAALHAGRIDEAREQLATCEHRARRSPSPRLEVGIAYARPLVADDDNAEALFQAALRDDLAAWPLYRARLLLQYGTWLRRRRKVVQARPPLRAARDSLLALGATPWVDRARQELRASRESHHSGPGAWMQLTEQELQIARMAAQGLTNREIGQRLYISPRTVGAHLYHIFPKLGIATRAQLAAVLEA